MTEKKPLFSKTFSSKNTFVVCTMFVRKKLTLQRVQQPEARTTVPADHIMHFPIKQQPKRQTPLFQQRLQHNAGQHTFTLSLHFLRGLSLSKQTGDDDERTLDLEGPKKTWRRLEKASQKVCSRVTRTFYIKLTVQKSVHHRIILHLLFKKIY